MKKALFFAAALTVCSSAAFAQPETDRSMIFIDSKTGEEITDGSIVNRTEVEELQGSPAIFAGVSVKNITNEKALASAYLDIQALPEYSAVQICFPEVCQMRFDIETCETPKGVFEAGVVKDMQTEWIPEAEGAYGTCTVSYQLKFYDLNSFDQAFKAYGPKITINYIYTDATGIDENLADKKLTSLTYYDLSGRKVSNPQHGVYVKKLVYADGTSRTEKVTIR